MSSPRPHIFFYLKVCCRHRRLLIVMLQEATVQCPVQGPISFLPKSLLQTQEIADCNVTRGNCPMSCKSKCNVAQLFCEVDFYFDISRMLFFLKKLMKPIAKQFVQLILKENYIFLSFCGYGIYCKVVYSLFRLLGASICQKM